MNFFLIPWFDYFINKKNEDFDYTGINCLKHREQRHHHEGINEAVKIYSKKYGDKYKKIIRQEAERHVYDDMGTIYFAQAYRQIGFWKKIRGYENR